MFRLLYQRWSGQRKKRTIRPMVTPRSPSLVPKFLEESISLAMSCVAPHADTQLRAAIHFSSPAT